MRQSHVYSLEDRAFIPALPARGDGGTLQALLMATGACLLGCLLIWMTDSSVTIGTTLWSLV